MTAGPGGKRKNEKLIAARLRLPSPSGSGEPMSTQDVAEAINAFLWAKHEKLKEQGAKHELGNGQPTVVDRRFVSSYEAGRFWWPGEHYREAFRHVLQVETDSELGFHGSRGRARPTAATVTPVVTNGLADGAGMRLPEEADDQRRALLFGATAGTAGLAAMPRSLLRIAAQESALLGGTYERSTLDRVEVGGGALESLRAMVDELADTGAISDQIDRLERAVNRHAVDALSMPPATMLSRLVVDIADTHRVGAAARSAIDRRTIRAIAARLAVLVADEHTVLGQREAGARWYRSAIAVADATGDQTLRVDIRSLAALLPLYHGSAAQTAAQAERAYAVAGGTHGVGPSLAPMLTAVARATLGATSDALAALDTARREFDHTGSRHRIESVFGFSTRRFRFYEGRVLVACGRHAEADRVHNEALSIYPADVVGDPTLIYIDRAENLIRSGDIVAGADQIVMALVLQPDLVTFVLFESFAVVGGSRLRLSASSPV